MKKKSLILSALLLASGVYASNAGNSGPFAADQHFYFRPQSLPLTGIDVLRKDVPYILVRDVGNSTNGKQENRIRLLTLPDRSGTPFYKTTATYRYDKNSRSWVTVNERQYQIAYAGSQGERITSYILKRFDAGSGSSESFLYRVFAGQQPVDSILVYLIKDADTMLFMHEHYSYGIHPYPDKVVQVYSDGNTSEHQFSYNGQGSLLAECMVETDKGLPADTLVRKLYERDTSGRLTRYEEISYKLQGMHGQAVTTESRAYGYDVLGRIASCKTYKPDSTRKLIPERTELYTYNAAGKPETIVSMTLHDGHIFRVRQKIEIFYNGNTPAYAWEYPWKDNDFSHFASGYYLFSSTDPSLQVDKLWHTESDAPYPNPCGRYLNLHPNLSGPVQIFDIHGRLMLETIADENGVVDLERLTPGTYLLVTQLRSMTIVRT